MLPIMNSGLGAAPYWQGRAAEFQNGQVEGITGTAAVAGIRGVPATDAVAGIRGVPGTDAAAGVRGMPGVDSSAQAGAATERVARGECQACKERKYMDRSDEADVSFQSPTHISPGQSAAKVMSHEREHVQNAVTEGNRPDKKLLSVSVALKTGICPECGRIYIAGGTTRTQMLTYKENPYDQGRKTVEGSFLRGMNLDEAV